MPPSPASPLGFGPGQPPEPPAALCPCGGGAYGSCCGPLVAGAQQAATAEQLMRSRYSAFARAARDPRAIEHLLRIHTDPSQPAGARRRALQASCRQLQWIGLTVLAREGGGPRDQQGTVTFAARWRDRAGQEGVLQECSRFGRGAGGEWLYLEAMTGPLGEAGFRPIG